MFACVCVVDVIEMCVCRGFANVNYLIIFPSCYKICASVKFVTYVPGLSCDVQLEVYVDKNTVGSLNSGKDNLEDILVLHLHGGKDIFVSLNPHTPSLANSG